MTFSNNGFDTFLFYIFFEHTFTLILDVFPPTDMFSKFCFQNLFYHFVSPPLFWFHTF